MCERQSQNKLRLFYHFGPTGKASEIALCLGTFYRRKRIRRQYPPRTLKKQRGDGRGGRGRGMRGFGFSAADRRWRLDHLTNSFHFILRRPSRPRLSLPISPRCTAVTPKVSSIERRVIPLHMMRRYMYSLKRREGGPKWSRHKQIWYSYS